MSHNKFVGLGAGVQNIPALETALPAITGDYKQLESTADKYG